MSDTIKMKVCPKCKSTFIGWTDINYCEKDGTKLIDRQTHDCGAEIKEGTNFCAKCGKPVNQEGK